MKKYTIFILLVLLFSVVHSQDVIKGGQKSISDSLLMELGAAKANSARELKAARDSVNTLISKIGGLEKDNSELNKSIKRLNGVRIGSLEKERDQKVDSIRILKDTISSREKQIADLGKAATINEIKKRSEGAQSVYDQIGLYYQNGTLDDLIRSSTKRSAERDVKLVGDNVNARKKIQYLQLYFSAQEVFEEKYDEQKVKRVETSLNGITEKSQLLDSLKTKLSNYSRCSGALSKAIENIIAFDKTFTANDDYTQEKKLGGDLAKLAWYIRNYHFNFYDYPYLAGKILEIIKIKQIDANTDLTDFLSKF